MSEHASVRAGEICSPADIMQSIEALDGRTVLPMRGVGVEHRQLQRVEPLPPSEPATGAPMRDHTATRSYRFTSAEQRERVQAAADASGMSLSRFIETDGGRS